MSENGEQEEQEGMPGGLPEASFVMLVAGLSTQVMLNLGEIPNDMGSMNDPDGTDPAVCGEAPGAFGEPYAITVAAGETYSLADFGYYAPGPSDISLVSFAASPLANAIQLTWETASEMDNLGFNLYRAEAVDGARSQLNGRLIPVQMPGSSMGATYQFLDEAAQPGVTYYYWLEDVDVYSVATQHGPVSAALGHKYGVLLARPRRVPVPLLPPFEPLPAPLPVGE